MAVSGQRGAHVLALINSKFGLCLVECDYMDELGKSLLHFDPSNEMKEGL